MDFTEKPDITCASIATEPVGLVVVVLESVALGTTSSVLRQERALTTIACHTNRLTGAAMPRTPDDVSASSRFFLGLFVLAKRRASSRSSFSSQPHRRVDDRSEVAPGRERGEPFQLVTKLTARGEPNDLWGAIVYGESFQTGDP